jgi:hypothetical protein
MLLGCSSQEVAIEGQVLNIPLRGTGESSQRFVGANPYF